MGTEQIVPFLNLVTGQFAPSPWSLFCENVRGQGSLILIEASHVTTG